MDLTKGRIKNNSGTDPKGRTYFMLEVVETHVTSFDDEEWRVSSDTVRNCWRVRVMDLSFFLTVTRPSMDDAAVDSDLCSLRVDDSTCG